MEEVVPYSYKVVVQYHDLTLTILSSFNCALCRYPANNPYKCFEHDDPLVDTSIIFYDSCEDNHGYVYNPARPEDPAQLKSCYECLE